MGRGRQGFYLEAWKFGVYLLIPILSSVYFSDPKRQKAAADYWQYVKVPANPNVGLKQKIEELAKQQEQREAYREQLKMLSEQAAKAEKAQQEMIASEDEPVSNRGWLRWIGLGRSQSK